MSKNKRVRGLILDPMRVAKYAALCGIHSLHDFQLMCFGHMDIAEGSDIPSNAWNGKVVDGNKVRQIASLLGLPSHMMLMPQCHEDIEYPEPREWRVSHSPGSLLKAEYGIVPFHFREKELSDLDGWCREGDRLSVRLYTGLGGMGKTRLAIEQCQRLDEKGKWIAGFLKEIGDSSDLGARFSWLKDEVRPLLVVIDYAETRREEIVAFIRASLLSKNKVRLLLLARSATDWWSALKTESKGVGDLFMGSTSQWVTLKPLTMGKEQREESYYLAANNFANYLGVSQIGRVPKSLTDRHYQQTLILHMQALIDLEGSNNNPSLKGILEVTLNREKRFWELQLESSQLPKYLLPYVGVLVARITNAGGIGIDEDPLRVFEGLDDLTDLKSYQRKAVIALIHGLYPSSSLESNNYIEPLRPDLLGEYLIADEMKKNHDLIADYIDYN